MMGDKEQILIGPAVDHRIGAIGDNGIFIMPATGIEAPASGHIPRCTGYRHRVIFLGNQAIAGNKNKKGEK